MKIIQSYWTKPAYHNSTDINSRFNGGWPDQKKAFYSFALSALSIREQYQQLELYTDTKGKQLFNELLELPYTQIHTTLDSMDDYDPGLWALGKLKVCAAQETPFLHIDNDIFLWDKIDYQPENYHLIAQNIEEDFPNYGKSFKYMLANFDKIPNELLNTFNKHKKILAYNAGVIGGTQLDFFKELSEKAFDLIHQNDRHLKHINLGIFNTIFEQQLGYSITEKQQLNIQYLYDHVSPNFAEIIDFSSVQVLTNYIHCIGFAKKSVFACEQIEARLAYHFPEYYKHINTKLSKEFIGFDSSQTISKRRLDYIFKCYDFMANNTIDQIWNTPFKVTDNCTIDIDSSPIKITYKNPYNDQYETQKLDGWNMIILYFMEPVTISELYEELITDPDILKKFNSNILKFKADLLSFVLEKTLLLEVLSPI
ncbi:DUF6734 family protein [Aquimarina rhabdastrellae]